MGVTGRDYMRERSLPFSGGTQTPAVWWIIGVNILVWVFSAGSARSGGGFGAFVYGYLTLIPERVLAGEVWRLLTAFWVHSPSGFSHVFFNMLLLFFLGRSVEARLGTRSFWKLYLASGLASTVFLVLFYLATQRSFMALGASGAVYGVVTWLATVEPRRTIYLFGILAMPLWLVVGVLMVGAEVMALGDPRQPMEPALGHLAGAACGFLFARFGRTFEIPRTAVRPRPPGPPAKLDARPKADPDVRARVDGLLTKIHDEGIGALSEAEKKFLQEASQRYR